MKMIGNYPANHDLAIQRCIQIAQYVKFIVNYEKKHGVRLDRERGDIKLFLWAFTCDAPGIPGYDAVKYSECHHPHSLEAARLIKEARTKSRRKIKGLRHEHVIPLSKLRQMLFECPESVSGNHITVSKFLSEFLHVAVITREEALALDRRFRTTMPDDWKPGDDPYSRYSRVGIDLIQPMGAMYNT